MPNNNDTRDVLELAQELRDHPDCVSLLVFTKRDMQAARECADVDKDINPSDRDIRGTEDYLCGKWFEITEDDLQGRQNERDNDESAT